MIHEKLTGRKIKRVCEERGLTVQEIRDRLGIGAHQSVYNWFNGKAMPTLDNYYSLCKLLGVTMESLIVEDDGSDATASQMRDTKVENSRLESQVGSSSLESQAESSGFELQVGGVSPDDPDSSAPVSAEESHFGTCIFRIDFFFGKIRCLARAERFRADYRERYCGACGG